MKHFIEQILPNEIFLPASTHEGLYEISNLGRVVSIRLNKKENRRIMTPVLDKDGYLTVRLRKNGKHSRGAIHRLIAQAFIPNPENKPQVNHINGIKTDNRIENIEWCTCQENIIHGIKMGLKVYAVGFNSKKSIVTKEMALEIYNLLLSGKNYKYIKGIFGISSGTSRKIKYKRGHFSII